MKVRRICILCVVLLTATCLGQDKLAPGKKNGVAPTLYWELSAYCVFV